MGDRATTFRDWNGEDDELLFSYIDLEPFRRRSLRLTLQAAWLRLLVLHGFFILAIDVILVVFYLNELVLKDKTIKSGLSQVRSDDEPSATSAESPLAGKIEIIGYTYMVSFVIAWGIFLFELYKARKVVKSGSIPLAFTSVFAHRWLSLRSYLHLCFFDKVRRSRKTIDKVAFWVFFRLKGWKRLLFASTPQTVIRAVTVYAILNSYGIKTLLDIPSLPEKIEGQNSDPAVKYRRYAIVIISAVLIADWAFSILSLILASLVYVPLRAKIKGTLKTYCRYKINKRIHNIMRKRADANRASRLSTTSHSITDADLQQLKRFADEEPRRYSPTSNSPASSSFSSGSYGSSSSTYSPQASYSPHGSHIYQAPPVSSPSPATAYHQLHAHYYPQGQPSYWPRPQRRDS